MADLGEKVAQVEGLVDKRLKFLGLRFTYTSLVAAFALISTIVGSLHGGFLLYQKVAQKHKPNFPDQIQMQQTRLLDLETKLVCVSLRHLKRPLDRFWALPLL